MHIPTITVIYLNKTRQKITRRLLHSKCIASKYLTDERSGSYKSRPAPHLHLDKLRNLKVIAWLSYRSLCLGNEFQLSGLWGTELVGAGSGTTLGGTCRFPPAWVALNPQQHLLPPQESSGLCRVPSPHDTVGQCKGCEMVLVGVKCCVKRRAMAEGRWHYRDNNLSTDTFLLRLLSPISTFMFMV